MELGKSARTRAKEIHERAHRRIKEDQDRIAREFAEREREQERQEEIQLRKLESDKLVAQEEQRKLTDPGYAINSDHLAEKILAASPRWPDDIHSPAHPHTNPPNRTKLGDILKKIVSPAVRKGIREGIPDFMIQPRILHNKIAHLLDSFCTGLDSEANCRAREMLLAYKQSIETIETKTVARVAKEWEVRANHSEYKARIAQLETTNALMKEQSIMTISMNAALQKEAENLRRINSTSTEEYKILKFHQQQQFQRFRMGGMVQRNEFCKAWMEQINRQ
ncbi:hypothetical protein HDU98_008482 [Podochytrium sp. JEL0797]|nr:hypothetical protein HDU98_008482 [Podochytrium sp. JEL0797]